MRLAFVHFPGRIARLQAARDGTGPTEFLFGAVELERAGHDIEHYEVDPAAGASGLARRLVDLNAGRGLLPPHLASSVLRQTRALIPRLRQAEVVVATTTGVAMALATWSRLGLFRRPLVGVVAGLLNAPWRPSRRATTLALLRRMHAVLYGVGELPLLQGLPGLDGRVHVVPFGVDASFWTPDERAPTNEVVAIGNDGHRDWRSLLAAARLIDAPVHVFTGHEPPSELPDNVSWSPSDWYRQVLSDEEVRELYCRAGVVVVPVQDVPQPSGQSVTLQAMACARPVVLSRTRGLWAPETLHDGKDVVFVPPSDPTALARAVSDLLSDRERARSIGAAARSSVLREAGVGSYAERLLAVCRAAIDRP